MCSGGDPVTAASTPATRMRRMLHVGAWTLTCLLTLVPWTYRNYALRGKLMPVATMGAIGSRTTLRA